jgi:Fe(3+) dicitrate transport protein
VNFGATYTDSMRETAGSGQPAADEKTEAYAMLDVMAQYEVIDGLTIYARGENLNGATPIASRLPFGARPAKPRMAQAGVSWEF